MSTFTPSDIVDMSKEKDWAASLGMMDWDNTRIVFTKRSLIEFLRYTGTTVDTNFSNIQKLPKYATFGKLSGETGATTQSSANAASSSTATESPFSHYVDDDALASAPPQGQPEPQQAQDTTTTSHSRSDSLWDNNTPETKSGFRPTRRVREMPGGRDSIADIL